jgi:hypothetical protein
MVPTVTPWISESLLSFPVLNFNFPFGRILGQPRQIEFKSYPTFQCMSNLLAQRVRI